MVSDLNTKLKGALQRAENAEKRCQELQKKVDDYKRAYSDSKTHLSKAQSDLEKLKGSSDVKQPSESETKEKYEQLKFKSKVSLHSFSKQVVFPGRTIIVISAGDKYLQH